MDGDAVPGELTVLEAAARLRESTDAVISARLELHPEQGRSVSCRVGCAACCRHLVVVSLLEALAIGDYVKARPELHSALELRLPEWRERVRTGGLTESLDRFEQSPGGLPDAEGAELELAYWRLQVDCPFLEEERCSIYPVRPFGCREHCVTSPPELCSLDPDAATHAGTRLETRAVAAEIGARCFGLEDRVLLLSGALAYFEHHRAAVERAAPADEMERVTEDARRRARLALARLQFARGGKR